MAAVVVAAVLAGCGSRSEIEQTYDRYATMWGMSPEEAAKHSEEGLRAAADANCDKRGRVPITTATMDPETGFIVTMSAAVMAVCPSQAPDYIAAHLDEGPSMGPLHDKLARMLADVQG